MSGRHLDEPYLASIPNLVQDVRNRVVDSMGSEPDFEFNFRPNLVVSGALLAPYDEDNWVRVAIGDRQFTVSSVHDCLVMSPTVMSTPIRGERTLQSLHDGQC